MVEKAKLYDSTNGGFGGWFTDYSLANGALVLKEVEMSRFRPGFLGPLTSDCFQIRELPSGAMQILPSSDYGQGSFLRGTERPCFGVVVGDNDYRGEVSLCLYSSPRDDGFSKVFVVGEGEDTPTAVSIETMWTLPLDIREPIVLLPKFADKDGRDGGLVIVEDEKIFADETRQRKLLEFVLGADRLRGLIVAKDFRESLSL